MQQIEPIISVTLICLAFFTIHSMFIAESVKRGITRLMGHALMDRWYTAFYSAISLFSLTLCLWLIWRMDNVFIWRAPWGIAWGMHAVQLAGLIFGAVSYGQIRRHGFATGTEASQTLLTTGGYGVVRNPLYLAGIIVMVFEPNITRNWLVVRALAVAYFVWGAWIEERRFIARYGESCRQYIRDVPLLIPRPAALLRWILWGLGRR